jgi:uncharacterized delta-60 repeat protein
VQLSNGKILIAGSSGGASTDFNIKRLNADGSIDNSFGTSGQSTIADSNGNDYVSSLRVQADGKILIAGYSYNYSNYTRTDSIVRLSADGVIDTSFGNAGTVLLPASSSGSSIRIAIQSDGKIVAASSGSSGHRTSLASSD